MRNAEAFELVVPSRLRAFRNANRLGPVECFHMNFRPERGLRDVDGKSAVEIVLSPLVNRMLGDFDDNVQVAGLSARSSGIPFASKAQSGSVIHTGRDRYFELLLRAAESLTPAL